MYRDGDVECTAMVTLEFAICQKKKVFARISRADVGNGKSLTMMFVMIVLMVL